MPINYQVYGTADQWVNITPFKAKMPYFGDYGQNQSWYNMIQAGRWEHNQPKVDTSIALWGVGADSYTNTPLYPALYKQGSVTSYTLDVDYISYVNNQGESQPLYITSGGTVLNERLAEWAWDDGNTNQSYYGTKRPLIDFNYNECIMICYVGAINIVDGVPTQTELIPLDQYYDDDSPNNYKAYPYILNIVGRLYFSVDGVAPTNRRVLDTFFAGHFVTIPDLSQYNYGKYKTPFNRPTYHPYCGYYHNRYIPIVGCDRIGIADSNIEHDSTQTFARNMALNKYIPSCYGTPSNHIYYNNTLITYWTQDTLPKSEVYRQCAFMGFVFSGTVADNAAVLGEQVSSPTVNYPIFDDNFVTTGEYKSGTAARDLPNVKWGDVNDSVDYNPDSKQPGEEKDDNIISGIALFSVEGNTKYALTASEFDKVHTIINTIPNYTEDTSKWYNIDPADFIIGAYYYPFTIVTNTSPELFKLGITGFEINGTPVEFYKTISGTQPIDYGTINIDPYYNDFRDYEPFTTYDIYMPFMGTYHVDPTMFVGHSLTLSGYVDFATHSYVLLVYRDAFVYDYIQGNIGMSLPLTALAHASYSTAMASLYNSASRLDTSQVFATLANTSAAAQQIARGDVGGVVDTFISSLSQTANNVYSRDLIDYQLKNTMPKPVAVSNSGGSYNLVSDRACRLIIRRHYTLSNTSPTIYGNTVGYACCMSTTLSNVHGLTFASNITFNDISATPAEESMISSAFANGVILP